VDDLVRTTGSNRSPIRASFTARRAPGCTPAVHFREGAEAQQGDPARTRELILGEASKRIVFGTRADARRLPWSSSTTTVRDCPPLFTLEASSHPRREERPTRDGATVESIRAAPRYPRRWERASEPSLNAWLLPPSAAPGHPFLPDGRPHAPHASSAPTHAHVHAPLLVPLERTCDRDNGESRVGQLIGPDVAEERRSVDAFPERESLGPSRDFPIGKKLKEIRSMYSNRDEERKTCLAVRKGLFSTRKVSIPKCRNVRFAFIASS